MNASIFLINIWDEQYSTRIKGNGNQSQLEYDMQNTFEF